METKTIQPSLIKRLTLEKSNLENSPFEFFSVSPEENDIFTWKGVLFGPEKSCYEGGIFKIKLEIPFDYPMKPPKCLFLTQIFHPNIFPDTGYICLNILQPENWNPSLDLEKVLISIHSLLAEPNFNHKVIDGKTGKEIYHSVTALGQTDEDKFRSTAREWVRRYAQL
jgi:ubiquitin-protein ligase